MNTGRLRPAAILFDWDNTLVDSWAVIHEALARTFTAFELTPWTMVETRERVRHSLVTAFPPLFGDRWERARDHYLSGFEAIHLERLAPIAGAERLLRRLGAEGIPLGVVSNKTGRLLRREVAALGWIPLFGGVVGAGDASADKPHRAPVDLALSGSGIPAGETVWYVGDTGIDVECAINAGCVPVLVQGGPEEPAMCRARHRFADFDAFEAALFGLEPCIPERT